MKLTNISFIINRCYTKKKQLISIRCARHVSSTTVSKEEVAKFSALSSTWWDPQQNPLIAMNPSRMKQITNVIRATNRIRTSNFENNHDAPPLSNLRILDVGCGGGLLSESLARLGAEVVAIDPSVEIVEIAKAHAVNTDLKQRDKIDYLGGVAIEDLDFNKEQFDVICIMDMLEHTAYPEEIINCAASLLKKPADGESDGGVLFLSTLNKTLLSYLFAIVGAEYVTSLLPKGTHDWNLFLSPENVHSMISANDLQPIEVKGMIAKPSFMYGLTWHLDSFDTSINWIGAYQFRK